ncbi:MAG: Rrf2 family transcriptional regulator [Firmicutes bacterium]|jgi:Rrf2 family protein|nr:Rrf2 family transcriptional regulator [Bacillota bacterium]
MVTNKLEYLLLTLLDLALNDTDDYVVSRDVAEGQGISPKYMPQLMALLTRKGWVDSARGCKGGVKLVADPREITVSDVVEVAGEPLIIKPCVSSEYHCERKQGCPLNLLWLKAQMSVDRIAENTTLADLLEIKSRLEMRMLEEDSPDAEGKTASLA